MDHVIVVRGMVDDALSGSFLFHVRADGGQSGCEVVEGVVKCDARMIDGIGDELHPSLVFCEGRDEGGECFGLLRNLDVAAEVSTKADLEDDDGTLFLVERGRFWGGGLVPPSHRLGPALFHGY